MNAWGALKEIPQISHIYVGVGWGGVGWGFAMFLVKKRIFKIKTNKLMLLW